MVHKTVQPTRTKSNQPESGELTALLSLSTRRKRAEYKQLARLSADLAAREGEAGKPWDEQDTAELGALLAEYSSLRLESLNTVTNRTQILMLGMAAMAALAGTTLASDRFAGNKVLVTAVFSGAIPLVSIFVFLVWLSEAVRSHRVGHFLASDVEARVNRKLGRLVMTWEAALWTRVLPRDEWWGPSMVACLVVLGLGWLAPVLGVVLNGLAIAWHGRPLWEVWIPYSFLLATLGYAALHLPRLRNKDAVASAIHEQG